MLKPKGNGISPEGWQGKHNNSAKPPYLPCHYAVSFWWGGAVAVRLIFATFCSFFNPIPINERLLKTRIG